MRVLAVPRNRVAFFRKEGSAVLKEIRARGEVEVRLNDDGNLEIEGDGGREWIAEQVLRALAYGFEPKHAFKLFGDDYFIEVMDLELLLRKSERLLERQKARIIGENGRVKKNIEELSGARLCVSGNEVAILGKFNELKIAKDAVNKILDGKEIPTVYAFLEKYGTKGK